MTRATGPTRARSNRPHAYQVNAYRPTMGAVALLCALLALLVLFIAQHTELSAAAHALLRGGPEALAPRDVALLVLATAIPLAAAISAYILGSQGVRLLRIWLYLRRMHAYAGRRLRSSAPLYSSGLLPQVQRLGPRAETQGEPFAVHRLLSASAPVLLSGEPGSGKTTALLSLAYELSRRRAVLSIFFGRQRLPVLVPLAGYAANLHGAAGPQLEYLQREVARYGSAGLAARLPRLLRQGRVLLLCDSLGDAPLGAQGRILEDLALVPPARTGPAVILARTSALGVTVPEYVDIEWEHWRVAPLSSDEMLRAVQSALPPKRSGGMRRNAGRLRDELQAHRLDRALCTPALLLAVTTATTARPTEKTQADTPLPYGRAALLRQALEATCTQEATEQVPGARLRETLGALASALAHADLHAVPLPQGARLGEAMAAWLGQHHPLSPHQSVTSGPSGGPPTGPLALSAEVAHACCLAGLHAGILAVSSDDSGLAFSHSLVEAAFAAEWLRAADDGGSALDAGLLRPRWVLPLVLWTATTADPGVITRRLLPLLQSRVAPHSEARKVVPHTVALATHTSEPRTPTGLSRPAGVALALAGITAALAPALAALVASGRPHEMELARLERRLREVLDAVLDLLTPDHDPAALLAAVQSVEGVVGEELAADVAYLASIGGFSRLARAQLVSILGLLASPQAIAALVEHLADKDVTLRSAVIRGFTFAGSRGIGALQRQLTSENDWIRARAREALDGVSAAQLVDGHTAEQRAVHVLTSPDPSVRAAAAETLGVLQAHDAVDGLVARLGDSDSQVRSTALRALAKLADPLALSVLREHLRHPDPAFRAALADALGAYHDPELIPDLALLLADSDSAVRAAAATALGVMGDDRALAPLVERWGDPDPHAQAAVASALRRLSHGHEGSAYRRTNAPRATGAPTADADWASR